MEKKKEMIHNIREFQIGEEFYTLDQGNSIIRKYRLEEIKIVEREKTQPITVYFSFPFKVISISTDGMHTYSEEIENIQHNFISLECFSTPKEALSYFGIKLTQLGLKFTTQSVRI